MDIEGLRFTPCRAADVAALERAVPTPSVHSFHVARLAEQERGEATYLVAWDGDRPVGHALIRWGGCVDEGVRGAHPDCPEINGLEVTSALRSRGVGTALIRAAERWAHERGFVRIGLGVADVNPRARALYERLGYGGDCAYVDRYECVDSLGTTHRFADPCVFLVRSLPRETMTTVTS